MYVTDVNQCIALDAGSGREVWRFIRPKTPKLFNDAGVNRGVAVAGDKVFLETDNAHIVALNRFTGEQVWDSHDRRFGAELLCHFRAARRRATWW